jgi:hypothetical protein
VRSEDLRGKQGDYDSALENIVYFELLRREYEVAVGKLDSLEVDFIAWNDTERIYYQVTAAMTPPEPTMLLRLAGSQALALTVQSPASRDRSPSPRFSTLPTNSKKFTTKAKKANKEKLRTILSHRHLVRKG